MFHYKKLFNRYRCKYLETTAEMLILCLIFILWYQTQMFSVQKNKGIDLAVPIGSDGTECKWPDNVFLVVFQSKNVLQLIFFQSIFFLFRIYLTVKITHLSWHFYDSAMAPVAWVMRTFRSKVDWPVGLKASDQPSQEIWERICWTFTWVQSHVQTPSRHASHTVFGRSTIPCSHVL